MGFLPSMHIKTAETQEYLSSIFECFPCFLDRSLSTVIADSKKLKKQNKRGKRLGPLCAILQWDLCGVMNHLLLSKVPNYLSVKCCIRYLRVQQPPSLSGYSHLFDIASLVFVFFLPLLSGQQIIFSSKLVTDNMKVITDNNKNFKV